jgi:hypothetical protein
VIRLRDILERIEAVGVGTLMALALVAMLVQLAGCSSSAQVTPADRDAALAFVRNDQAPLKVKPVAMWYASDEPGSMVCGEIEAPPALGHKHDTLRYVVDRKTGVRQVEMHELWITASPVSAAALQANRAAFDALWTDYCRPYAPLSRRLAQWFGS